MRLGERLESYPIRAEFMPTGLERTVAARPVGEAATIRERAAASPWDC
jgi:hypothetical protein